MRAAAFRTIALLLLVSLGVAGCGDGDSAAQATAQGCEKVAAPKSRTASLPRPQQSVRPGEKLTAAVKTNCGSFDIALDTKRAPKTTNSFVYLARKGFYDGLDFHRVVPDFVVQGGDPLGDGTGGPGYQVDEKPPPNLAYTRGVVAMAKSPVEPPGRSGSQFFIVTAAAADLGPDYALLGRVDRGMNVVERIGRLGTPSQAPSQTVLIERITIERG